MKQEKKNVKASLKRDELASMLVKTIKFVKNSLHKDIKVIKIVSGVIVISGLVIAIYFIKKTNDDKKAGEIFVQGLSEYKNEKYEDTLPYLKDIYTKYGISKFKGISFYYSGNCYFNLGKYDSAVEFFEKASSGSVSKIIRIQSMEGIAYCYEQKKDYKKAEEILLKLSKKLGVSFLAPEILFNLARIYELQGKNKDAIDTYQEIVNSYVNSSWANQAKIKIEMLK